MKSIYGVYFCKIFIMFNFCALSFLFFSCKTISKDPVLIEHKDFLTTNKEADETFRVLIISNKYISSQMKFHEQLKKVEDLDGDSNICNKLKEYDKINEICEGILTVSLFPNSGKLMKIRPKALAPIAEVNSLIVEDLKRWNFEFPTEVIYPNIFDIKYRIVLRKLQSDKKIMKEVMKKSMEEAKKKERKEQARKARQQKQR